MTQEEPRVMMGGIKRPVQSHPPGFQNIYEFVSRLPWVDQLTWDLDIFPQLDWMSEGLQAKLHTVESFVSFPIAGFADGVPIVMATHWDSVADVQTVKTHHHYMATIEEEFGTEGLHVVDSAAIAAELLDILRDYDDRFAALPDVHGQSVRHINQLLTEAEVEPAPVLVSSATIGRLVEDDQIQELTTADIDSVEQLLAEFSGG